MLEPLLMPDSDGAMTEASRQILLYGIQQGASDLHIEPWGPCLRYRVQGYFEDVYPKWTLNQCQGVVGYLKVLGSLQSWETGLVQEGRIDPEQYGGQTAVRVSVFPTIHGDKIVIRFASDFKQFQSLEDLGYPDFICSELRQSLHEPSGLILIHGSSNSGKTTAAYTCLFEILERRSRTVSIATLEDPVEHNTGRFAQTDLSNTRSLTYAKALQALLRQDPEVLFIGEIRNQETAQITFEAALTGHLILSSVHAGSLQEALSRLLSFDLSSGQILLVLKAALGVKLRSHPQAHQRKALVSLLSLDPLTRRKLIEAPAETRIDRLLALNPMQSEGL